MRIVVQKFGGTSLSSAERRLAAVRHIEERLAEGFQVVVVVSAMGRKGDPYATDTLLSLTEEYGFTVGIREVDLLLACGEIISAVVMAALLASRGHRTTVLTGPQAGIWTDRQFGQAQIIRVEPDRIIRDLHAGHVVIVPGFQGKTWDGEITTLGRGGSDTSAVALGVALGAERVEIFTDVDGVMSADPRLVAEARLLEVVTYEEMAALSRHGAKVIHPQAVELAMHGGIPVRVRATGSSHPGTLITRPDSTRWWNRSDRPVTGIAHQPGLTQIKVSGDGLPYDRRYHMHVQVFKAMADHRISVDFINVNPNRIVYTVAADKATLAVELVRKLGYDVEMTPGCAKVSVVGSGMTGRPGVMAAIVEALTAEEIQILQTADSYTTIWLLVKETDMIRAVRALHRKFRLNADAKEEEER